MRIWHEIVQSPDIANVQAQSRSFDVTHVVTIAYALLAFHPGETRHPAAASLRLQTPPHPRSANLNH